MDPVRRQVVVVAYGAEERYDGEPGHAIIPRFLKREYRDHTVGTLDVPWPKMCFIWTLKSRCLFITCPTTIQQTDALRMITRNSRDDTVIIAGRRRTPHLSQATTVSEAAVWRS